MKIKFNKDGGYGFYSPEIHGEGILTDSDYIDITDEAYQMLMENQGLKMIGELPEGIEEIMIDHIIDVPEQEPAPPTVRELRHNQMEKAVRLYAETLPDEMIHEVALIMDEWEGDQSYKVGKVLLYENNLYRVRQDHTSQTQYPPSINTLSLYLMIPKPEEVEQALPWEDRWTMGKELYGIGDKVTHKGFTWESVVDNNIWEPGVANETIWKKIV